MDLDWDTKRLRYPSQQPNSRVLEQLRSPTRMTGLGLLMMLVLAGCDSKPKHYYVFCEDKDGIGWNLIDTESKNGYLIACTYQSPDKKQAYTARCRDSGCD